MAIDWNLPDPFESVGILEDGGESDSQSQQVSPDESSIDWSSDDPFSSLEMSVNTPESKGSSEDSPYVSEDRGLVMDTITAFGRGSLGLLHKAGKAYEVMTGYSTGLDEWTDEVKKDVNFFKPDEGQYYNSDGTIRKSWLSAVESIPSSLGGSVPGALGGAALGSFIPGIGTAAGGIIGGVLGTLGLFGAGTYGEKHEEALNAGLSEEQAHEFALKEGAIEGGLEAVATGAELATMGIGKLFTRPLVSSLRGLTKVSGKAIALSYVGTVGTEMVTEAMQSGLSAANAEAFGIENEGVLKSAVDSLLPAMFMAGIFASVGTYATNSGKIKLRKGLEAKDPQAIKQVTDILVKQDPKLAEEWKDYASEIVSTEGKSFDFNSELEAVFTQAREKEITEYEEAANDKGKLMTLIEDPEKVQAFVAHQLAVAEEALQQENAGVKAPQTFEGIDEALAKISELETNEEVSSAVSKKVENFKTSLGLTDQESNALYSTLFQKSLGLPGNTGEGFSVYSKVKEQEASLNAPVVKEDRSLALSIHKSFQKVNQTKEGQEAAKVVQGTPIRSPKIPKVPKAPKVVQPQKAIFKPGSRAETAGPSAYVSPKDSSTAQSEQPQAIPEVLKDVAEGYKRPEASDVVPVTPNTATGSASVVGDQTSASGMNFKEDISTTSSTEDVVVAREVAKELNDAQKAYSVAQTPENQERLAKAEQALASTSADVRVEAKDVGDVSAETVAFLTEDPKVVKKSVAKVFATNKATVKKFTSNRTAAEKSNPGSVERVWDDKTSKNVKYRWKDESGWTFYYKADPRKGIDKKGWYSPTGEFVPTGRADVFESLFQKALVETQGTKGSPILVNLASDEEFFKTATYSQKGKADQVETAAKNKDWAALEAKAKKELAASNRSVNKGSEDGGVGGAKTPEDEVDDIALLAQQDDRGTILDSPEYLGTGREISGGAFVKSIEDPTASTDALATLKTLAGSEDVPALEKSVATLLLNNLDEVLLSSVVLSPDLEFGRVNYSLKTKKINFNPIGSSDRAILHEIIHGVTADAVEGLGKKHPLMKRLSTIMSQFQKHVVDSGVITDADIAMTKGMTGSEIIAYSKDQQIGMDAARILYALKNPHEFLSMSLTEPAIQEYLEEVESVQKGFVQTAWDSIVGFVADVLYLTPESNNGLSEVLSLTVELGDTVSKFRGEKILGALEPGYNSYQNGFKGIKLKTSKKKGKDRQYFVKEGESKWRKVPKFEYRKLKKLLSDTRKKETQEYFKKYDNFTATEKIVEIFSRNWKEVTKTLSEYMEPVQVIVNRISPTLGAAMNKMEFNIATKNAEYFKKIGEYSRLYKKLSKADKKVVSWALENSTADPVVAEQILKDHGLLKSYAKVKEVLDDIHGRMDEIGLNVYKKVREYHPRIVSDPKGLYAYIKGHEDSSLFSDIVLDEDLTRDEKQDLIASALSTRSLPSNNLRLPSSVKARSIPMVDPEMSDKFYHDSLESLLIHIAETNEVIETRAFIGRTARKRTADSMLRVSKKLLKETSKKPADRDQDLLNSLKLEYHKLSSQYDGYDNVLESSVAEFLEKKAAGLSQDEKSALMTAITARLNQKGMHGKMAKLRDVGLITALGSPLNTVTQLGDFVWTVYKNTPQASLKALFGSKRVRPDDFGMDAPMKEFQISGYSEYVDKVLTATGFKSVDTFFKGVSMEASLKKAEATSEKSFVEANKDLLGGEELARKVHKDINAGEITDDVRFFVFSDVSKFQPISLSQMPAKYLTAGNGRIFYTLKSYSIKAISNIKREAFDKLASKDPEVRKQGGKSLVTLVGLLVVANAGIDELRDFLVDREDSSFSDKLVENLLKLGLMSRYTLGHLEKGAFFDQLLGDILVPPAVGVGDKIGYDLYNLVTDKDNTFKTLSKVPLLSFATHNRFVKVSPEKDLKAMKRYIYDDLKGLAKDGKGITKEVRKRIDRYNKKARKVEGEKPITIKTVRSIYSRVKKK